MTEEARLDSAVMDLLPWLLENLAKFAAVDQGVFETELERRLVLESAT